MRGDSRQDVVTYLDEISENTRTRHIVLAHLIITQANYFKD